MHADPTEQDVEAAARRGLAGAADDPTVAAPDGYGVAFADVYDDWYGDGVHGTRSCDDAEAAVAFLAALVRRHRRDADRREPCRPGPGTPGPGTPGPGRPGRGGAEPGLLELGAGTGRLALPLAALLGRGAVTALDGSPAMLARLRAKPGAGALTIVEGDMAGPLPAGPFAAVAVARNTLFNLADPAAQARCVAAVAGVLAPGGAFVVQAFVPGADPDGAVHVGRRTLADGTLVVTASRADAATQTVAGCHASVSAAGDGRVTVRRWRLHWKTPAQLDALCNDHGFDVEQRVSDWSGAVFDSESSEHVTVYRRRTA